MDGAFKSDVDPDGLMEFSVVFTDRSLNSMSKAFQGVMTDIGGMLKDVYKADHVAIVPGGGTFAMEAVARQFGADAHAFVLRNGWFSFRWSQIFDAGQFTAPPRGWPTLLQIPSLWTSRNGTASCRPMKMAATPITRRCRLTGCVLSEIR